MTDRPGWIDLIFKRWNAGHALSTSFLLNSTNQEIAELSDGQPNGREQLRQASLDELASDDSRSVALALVFLGVVGRVDELPRIEQFVQHPSELVRRAARCCRFELRHATGS